MPFPLNQKELKLPNWSAKKPWVHQDHWVAIRASN